MAQAEHAQKVAHQQRDIFATLTQRRQMNGEDIEAVEQVLAKAPGFNFTTQVQVGRGDHPHVHLDRCRAADPLDLALLQGAQDLALGTEAERGNLVQEQGPPMGPLETPWA
ncbi:hypothetical protein D3C85_791430 [compost metagenome]